MAQTSSSKAKSKQVNSKVQAKKPVQRKHKATTATRVTSRERNLQKQIAAKRKKSGAANRKKTTRKTAVKKSVSKVQKVTPSFASYNATEKKNYLQLTNEEEVLGADFKRSRGKLPWPVAGTVSIPYGDYTIEETKIKGRNPGITIATDKDVPVKAVFDGVVTDVDGNDEVATIYIKHGNYYTVYSNLSAIHVKKGALVKMGEAIGSVGEAYSAAGGELMFVVMAETDNVNPSSWLSK